MKKLVTLIMVSMTIVSIAKGSEIFNKTKITSIKFNKDVLLEPGSKRTLLSGSQFCYLLHDVSYSKRILSKENQFVATGNIAVTTSYSSYGNSGFARVTFEGLESTKAVSCLIYNKWDNLVTIQDIQDQLGDSVSINIEDAVEVN